MALNVRGPQRRTDGVCRRAGGGHAVCGGAPSVPVATVASTTRLWQTFQDTFASMPLTALVAGKILCMHGGLSPRLKHLDQLRNLRRPLEEPANPSIEMDLLWSDPSRSVVGRRANVTRNVSFVFDTDVVERFCRRIGIDLVARAHQVVQDGYELFANRRLVTIFSAPNYCGEFNNAAAVMAVDARLNCTFTNFRPSTH